MIRSKSLIILMLASCSNRFDVSLCFIPSPKQVIPIYSIFRNQYAGNEVDELISSRVPKIRAVFGSSIDGSSYQGGSNTGDAIAAEVANRQNVMIHLANFGRQSIEHIQDCVAKLQFFINVMLLQKNRAFKIMEASLQEDRRDSPTDASERESPIKIGLVENQSYKKTWWRHSAAFIREEQTKLVLFFTTLLIQKNLVSKTVEKASAASTVSFPPPKQTMIRINTPDFFNKIGANSNKLSSRIVEQSVKSLISNVSMHTRNFQVHTTGSKLSDVLNGKIKEATMTFDRLAFRNLKVSAGGSLIARNVMLTPLSFGPDFIAKFVPRYSEPFELDAQHCTLTQDDVMNSSCMRNGLQKLLNLVIKRVLLNASVKETIMALSVQQVRILGENKIACSGTGITVLGAPFPFEVRTGIRITDNGHVIRFPKIELVINPGPFQATIPIHAFFPVSVDIGPNAKIEQLSIDGKYERIHICLKATMIPSKSSMAHYRPIDDVTDAKFYCDVGVWGTRILRFDNSI